MTTAHSEKRTVFQLASLQALFQTTAVMMLTLSGLVGFELASDKSLATLPVASMMLAGAIGLIPAALLMQRIGRKMGFILGISLGLTGGLLGALAIYQHSFVLFSVAAAFIGVYQGFAGYYRFAAADAASPAFRSQAISWVISGGVIAALTGTNLARFTQNLHTLPFVASYLAIAVLSLFALIIASQLTLPAPAAHATDDIPRPLFTILRQPVFITALLASSVGSAMMVMVMTATPIAMKLCGNSLSTSASVIQWHVLGMFVPSFFTGALIQRFGVNKVITTGIILLGTHVAIALSGLTYLHFSSGLILLGVGWNFLFIGGTSLLTQAYRPSERAKTQATHDFLMSVAVTIGSFSAGSLLNHFGWRTVNLTVLPFLGLTLLAVLAFSLSRRQTAAG